MKRKIKVPRKYEGIGGDEFGRFDRVVRGLLAVPYQELQEELIKHKKKARSTKRARKSTSQSDASRDSEADAGTV